MSYSKDDYTNWLRNKQNIQSLLEPMNIKVNDFLASGGQGHVFIGEYQDQEVAIKTYFPGQLIERVDREVNALAQLDSYAIVKLLWNGKVKALDTSIPIVVTELVKGECLSAILQRRTMGEEETGIIMFDTACAIFAMWDQQKIVHRDIKPNNILIRPNGRACIIDLGVARHLDKSSLTATGSTWGTYGYFSPEQFRGVKQLTCKSDIYSLAIVIIECALGKHPTNGDQIVLMNQEYYLKLPNPVNSWKYSNLVQQMFEPKANMRPLPKEIIQVLDRFTP